MTHVGQIELTEAQVALISQHAEHAGYLDYDPPDEGSRPYYLDRQEYGDEHRYYLQRRGVSTVLAEIGLDLPWEAIAYDWIEAYRRGWELARRSEIDWISGG